MPFETQGGTPSPHRLAAHSLHRADLSTGFFPTPEETTDDVAEDAHTAIAGANELEMTSGSPRKTCTKCATEKTLDEFYRNGRSPDGHRGDCKVCVLRDRKERYRTDGPRLRARVRTYQASVSGRRSKT